MARLTLDQINQMTPDMAAYLQSLGYTIGGENEDGSPRFMSDEGNWISQEEAQGIFSGEDLSAAAADARRMQGVIDIADYSNPSTMAEYAKKGWNSPEAYLSQLYGGGERVGDYFVLPQAQDVRSAQMVGTPIVYNSPGLFKEFLTNAALLAAGGYGLNALTAPAAAGGAGAGATAGADAAWGVNAAGTGGTAAGTAAGEFGLSGATAGNLAGTGGLSSTAGGVTGLTAGGGLGLTVPATATAATSGALLTPAMLASMGLPAATSLGAGSALTAAQQMGGVGGATTAGAGTALSRVLAGTGSTADMMEVLGTAGSSALGFAGANNATQGYRDIANQFIGMGAPYRGLLQQSYQPGFSIKEADPAISQMWGDLERQASAKYGNPYDSPSAQGEILGQVWNRGYLPQLNTYRSQLGSFGQLGTNTAGTAMGSAVNAEGGMYDAIGSGLASLTKPKNPYEDMFKGLLAGYKLNTGSSLA